MTSSEGPNPTRRAIPDRLRVSDARVTELARDTLEAFVMNEEDGRGALVD